MMTHHISVTLELFASMRIILIDTLTCRIGWKAFGLIISSSENDAPEERQTRNKNMFQSSRWHFQLFITFGFVCMCDTFYIAFRSVGFDFGNGLSLYMSVCVCVCLYEHGTNNKYLDSVCTWILPSNLPKHFVFLFCVQSISPPLPPPLPPLFVPFSGSPTENCVHTFNRAYVKMSGKFSADIHTSFVFVDFSVFWYNIPRWREKCK